MMPLLVRRELWLVAAAICLVGCGPRDPRSRSFPVSGTVTFGGQPVMNGAITLTSDDPSLADDAGTIVNGSFKLLASTGKKTVRIRASREVPQPGPASVPREPVIEEYIPIQYNEQSQLTVEVSADKPNHFELKLDPKSAPP